MPMRKLRRPSLVVVALALTLLHGCTALQHRPSCGPPPCLHGVIPTVLTPYCCATGIDVRSLEAQIRRELAGGCHGLLVLGTLGEGETIPFEERVPVIRPAVSVAGPCVPVIVGIHTCDVNQAIAQMQQAKQLGATAVLVKFTGNPGASGQDVLAFYAALS